MANVIEDITTLMSREEKESPSISYLNERIVSAHKLKNTFLDKNPSPG